MQIVLSVGVSLRHFAWGVGGDFATVGRQIQAKASECWRRRRGGSSFPPSPRCHLYPICFGLRLPSFLFSFFSPLVLVSLSKKKTLFMPTHIRTCRFISSACACIYVFWQSEAQTLYLSLRAAPRFPAAVLLPPPPPPSPPPTAATRVLPRRRNRHQLLQSLPSASLFLHSIFLYYISSNLCLPACCACARVRSHARVCVWPNHLKCSDGVQILIHHACLLPIKCTCSAHYKS